MLEFTQRCLDNIVMLAKGNPGATRVLCEIANVFGENALQNFIADGIYGSDVWLAYKDYAGKNLEKCMQAVDAHDPEMWRIIKENR